MLASPPQVPSVAQAQQLQGAAATGGPRGTVPRGSASRGCNGVSAEPLLCAEQPPPCRAERCAPECQPHPFLVRAVLLPERCRAAGPFHPGDLLPCPGRTEPWAAPTCNPAATSGPAPVSPKPTTRGPGLPAVPAGRAQREVSGGGAVPADIPGTSRTPPGAPQLLRPYLHHLILRTRD